MDRDQFYREARTDLAGPLDGLRVLEATTTWAGPMCGCVLADFGADIVKVEHPDGEIARRSPPFLPGTDPPVSFMHATVNRNKRSLALDLRRGEGRDLFLDLAERSEVVIENFRPGTLEGWGLGYDAVRARRADVIYVSISGYGQFGSRRDRVGYDPLAQAESGYLSLNGSPEGEPVKSPTFLADDLAGLHAALAVLAALHHRAATGEGQRIDVSLLDSLWFQSTGYLTLGAMGVELPRLGNEFRIAAPANTYRCRDGRIMTGALLDSQWRALAACIGRPELSEHPDYATAPVRLERRSEVDGLVSDWAADLDVDAAIERLLHAGVPAAPVRSYAEAAREPLVAEREMLQHVEQQDGTPAPITGPAAKLSRTPTRIRSGAPALGAHTDEILSDLGLSPAEIARLRSTGTVA